MRGWIKAPPRTIMRRNTHTECYINFRVLYQLPRVIYQLPTVLYQLRNSEKAFQNGGSERKKQQRGKKTLNEAREERVTYLSTGVETGSKQAGRERTSYHTVAGRASDEQRQQGECQ